MFTIPNILKVLDTVKFKFPLLNSIALCSAKRFCMGLRTHMHKHEVGKEGKNNALLKKKLYQ